jgi:DNA repair exonuclease SbcCD nuclease subunit
MEMRYNPLKIDVNPLADLLILAGDIFNFSMPSIELSNIKYLFNDINIPILYVAGNHEYYGSKISQFNKQIKTILTKDNHYFLDNKSVVINGIKFIGSTLWSNFDGASNYNDFAQLVKQNINDFYYIKDFTPYRCKKLNLEARKFLEDELTIGNEPKFVITHFVPTFSAVHPKFAASSLNPYFICNCDTLIQKSNWWVFGHTHSSFNYNHLGCHMICNPHGYGQENKDFAYNNLIEI